MVKNWMVLGDEAFNSKHEPIGVVELTSEELNDWNNVLWKRFAHTVNTNEKVREMVFNSNYMYIGAVFAYVGRNSVSSIGQNQSLTSLLN